MKRTDAGEQSPPAPESEGRAKRLANDADRVFLNLVRAMGRASRWLGGKLRRARTAAQPHVESKRAPKRGRLEAGIAKELRKEATRARLTLSSTELARLADALAAVAQEALESGARVESDAPVTVSRATPQAAAPAPSESPDPRSPRERALQGIVEKNLSLRDGTPQDNAVPCDGVEALLVGIALGASSATISISDGRKRELPIGEDRPGEEAVERLDRDTAVAFLERIVRELALPTDRPSRGVVTVPTHAAREVMDALARHQVSVLNALTVTTAPLAVAYGVDALDDAIIVHMGGGMMELQWVRDGLADESDRHTSPREGEGNVEQLLLDSICDKHPGAQLTMAMAKALVEEFGYPALDDPPIEIELAVDDKPRTLDITDELRTACRSVVPALAAATEQLRDAVPGRPPRLVIWGNGARLRGLSILLEDAEQPLAEEVTLAADPPFAAADGALKIARDLTT